MQTEEQVTSQSLDDVRNAVGELWSTPLDERAAAEYLGISVPTLHRLRRSGRVKAERKDLRHWQFYRADLADLLPQLAPTDARPVTRLINAFLAHAIDTGASDALFEPDQRNLRTRFRHDGVLREIAALPKHLQTAIVSRLQTMAQMDGDALAVQTGTISIEHNSLSFVIRATFLPTQYGTTTALHFLDRRQYRKTAGEIGLTDALREAFDSLVYWRTSGLFLLAGPPGSGLTSTAYHDLNRLNTTEHLTVTLEEYTEYVLSGTTQIALGPRAGKPRLSRRETLDAALRQSPDVLFLGDIRDRETAECAVLAAQTGARVLATINAPNSLSALGALEGFGLSADTVARSVTGIMSQRLLPRVCSACGGAGCQECEKRGTNGRVGVFEVMDVNWEVKELIRRGAGPKDLRDAGRAGGSQFFETTAQIAWEKGLITEYGHRGLLLSLPNG